MNTKKRPVNRHLRRKLVSVAVTMCFAAEFAYANPTGPTVVNGQVSFGTSGNVFSITNTPGAIINWRGFSISANEITKFIQQSASSSVMNRVTGVDPSVILGSLTSNGRVFLINPNGITFGAGSQVNTAGFVASTLGLADADFLAGRYRFTEVPGAGGIVNQGVITTPAGGSIYLVAPSVANSGVIRSDSGEIVLAAGNSVELVNPQSPDLRVLITAPDNQAVNVGQIVAQSGNIGIYGGLIRQGGTVSANSAVMGANGKIVFKATKDVTLEAGSTTTVNGPQGGSVTIQSDTGTTSVFGTVEAKGSEGVGGRIQVLGNQAGLFDNATINASGQTGGGTVLIGGDYQGGNPLIQNASQSYVGTGTVINADAIASGDGGKVVVWGNDTAQFYGSITARGGANSGNGGFVETSGHNYLDARGRVNTLAPFGMSGTWLLDPTDITISTGVNSIENTVPGTFQEATTATSILNTTTLQNALLTTDVVVTTVSGAAGPLGGRITVANNVTTGAGNIHSLTLSAENNIAINANVSITGSGTLTLAADADNNGTGAITRGAAGNTLSQAAGVMTLKAAQGITATTVTPQISINNTTSGNVAITNTGALQINSATLAGAGTFNVTSSAAISQTGAIAVSGASTFSTGASGAAIALTDINNDFVGAVALTTTGAGGNIAINDKNSLIFGTVAMGNAASTFTATSNGAITQSGATIITSGTGGASFNSGAAGSPITLANANDFRGPVALTSHGAAGNISIRDINSLQLGTVAMDNAAGAFSAVSNGALTQAGATTITTGTGAVSFNSGATGAAITLTNANDFLGPVALTTSGAAGNITINDINALNFGSVVMANAASKLTVTSNGAITQSGATTITTGTGAVSFNSGGANPITLTNNNDFRGVVALTGGDTQLKDINSVSLGAVSTGNTFVQATTDVNLTNAVVTSPGAHFWAQAGRNVNVGTSTNHTATITTNGGGIILESDSPVANGAGQLAINANVASGGGHITLIGGGNAIQSGGGISLNASVDAGSGGINAALTGNASLGIGVLGIVTQILGNPIEGLITTGNLVLGQAVNLAGSTLTANSISNVFNGSNILVNPAAGSFSLIAGGGGIQLNLPLNTTQNTTISTTGPLTINANISTTGNLNLAGSTVSFGTGVVITATGPLGVSCSGTGCGSFSSLDNWTGTAGDHNWFTAGNWSNGVPTSASIVKIDAGLDPINIAGGTAFANTLTDGRPLFVTGTLNLAGISQINNTFTLQGGTLTAANSVTGSGSLIWNGGTMGGTGSAAFVFTGSSGTLSNSLTLNIPFQNQGVLTLSGATIGGTGSIANSGTLALAGATIQNTLSSLTNVGNGHITTAAGTSNVINSPFSSNAGIIRVEGAGSASPTSLTIANGFSNAGTIELNSDASSGAANLTISTGTIANSGLISATGGASTLSVATLTNTGNILVDGTGSTATLTIANGFANAGTIELRSGDVAGNAATFSTTAGSLTNNGTLKTAVGTFNTVGGNVVNASGGIIEVDGTGTNSPASLTITNGFTNAGTIRLNSDANSAATFAVGGLLTNSGTISSLGTTVNNAPPQANTLNAQVNSAGTIDLTNSLLIGGNLTIPVGGAITNSGDLAVVGDLNWASNSAIARSGPIFVSGITTLTANTNPIAVDLSTQANNFGMVNLTAAAGGAFTSVSVKDADATTLSNSATANGTSANGMNIGGSAGTLTANSVGQLTLTGGNYTTLNATSQAGINQTTAALIVSGTTTLTADATTGIAADLSTQANNFGTVALAATGTPNAGSFGIVSLKDTSGGIILGGGAATTLNVVSTGGITQTTAPLTISGTTTLTADTGANQTINLATQSNNFGVVVLGAANSGTIGTASVTDAVDAMSIGGSAGALTASALGQLTLTGGTYTTLNAISQSSSIGQSGAVTAGTLAGSAGATVLLDQSNTIANLGAFTSNGGFTLSTTGGLSVAGSVSDTSGPVVINFGQAGAGNAFVVTGTGSITGATSVNINGGTGSDTFNFSLAPAITATLSGGGGAGVDTLVGRNAANTWNITGSNSGNVSDTPPTGTIAFSGISNLTGGTLNDTFKLQNSGTTGTLSGTIDGGTGVNTLDYSGTSGAVLVTLTAAAAGGATNLGGGFSNIQALVGNDALATANTTLTGTNTGSTFSVTGANSGNVDTTFTFSKVGNLTGGTAPDTFKLVTGGSLTGAINGGITSTNTLDYSGTSGAVLVTLTGAAAGSATSVTGGFSNIQSLMGNDGTSGTIATLVSSGANSTFTINNANAGTITTSPVTGTFSFSGVGNLTGGAGDDTFKLANSGTLSGNVVGGGHTVKDTLDLSSKTSAVSINLQTGKATDISGTFSGINDFVGNGATTTLTGANFASTYNLLGANSGNVNGTLTFSGVGNLVGGTLNDTFKLATTVTTFNGSIAGGGGIDTLTATDGTNAWLVTGNNAGTLNTTTTFSGITNLGGGTGTDTLTGVAAGSNWSVTGPNAVTVSGMNATSMNALVGGAGNDTFTLATTVATFNGSIAGGGGIDMLAATDGTNAWLVTGNNAGTLNTTTTFSGITNLGGGTGTDTLTGVAAGSNWSISGPNAVTVSGMNATSMNALVGGAGNDTFTLAASVATFNGSIAGGGGIDTLAATDGTNAWLVTGNNAGTLNTTTTFSGITNLGGGTGTDTLTGVAAGSNWSISGPNAVTVSGMNGTSMEALVGGTGNDSFTLASAVPTFGGSISGGGGTDTLAATNGTNAWNITGPNAGTLNTTTTFSGIANLGGGTGTDTLSGTNQTYNLTGLNAGNNGTVSWTSFENLSDAAAGNFKFTTNTAAVSGNISAVGGTLDYSAGIAGPVTLNLAGTTNTTTGISGTWSGITTAKGSAASDTITGSGQTYNLTGLNAGNNGTVSWTSFENLIASGASTIAGGAGSSLSGSLNSATTALSGTITTGAGQTYGAVTTTGAVALNAGASAITATNPANSFGGTVTASGNTIQISNTGALTVVLSDAGSSTISAGGALAVSGNVAGTLNTATTGGATGTTSFGTTSAGVLSAVSSGAISQTGALIIAGAATFDTQANNAIGDVIITTQSPVAVGPSQVAGNFTLNAGTNAVSFAPNVDVAGNMTVSTTGLVSAGANVRAAGTNNALNDATTITATGATPFVLTQGLLNGVTGANVTVALASASYTANAPVTASAINLGSANSFGGPLRVLTTPAGVVAGATSNHDLIQTGTLDFGGKNVTIVAQPGTVFGGPNSLNGGSGSNVTLTQANTGLGSIGFSNTHNSAITTAAGQPVTLAPSLITGNLSVNSGGAVSQNGALMVSGAANINAGSNPITLLNTSNDFNGAVTLIGGATSVSDSNTLTLAGGNISSGLFTAGSAININGNLMATGGDLVLNAGNSVAVNNSQVSASGAISIDRVGGVGLFPALDINATSAPAILQAGSKLGIFASNVTLTGGAGSATISGGPGQFGIFSTGNVTLNGGAAGALIFGNPDVNLTVGGNIVLNNGVIQSASANSITIIFPNLSTGGIVGSGSLIAGTAPAVLNSNLHLFYGSGAPVVITSTPGGTQITITIPPSPTNPGGAGATIVETITSINNPPSTDITFNFSSTTSLDCASCQLPQLPSLSNLYVFGTGVNGPSGTGIVGGTSSSGLLVDESSGQSIITTTATSVESGLYTNVDTGQTITVSDTATAPPGVYVNQGTGKVLVVEDKSGKKTVSTGQAPKTSKSLSRAQLKKLPNCT